jgi:hypothetical protein
MLLKRSLCVLGILIVIAAAGFARRGTFWETHAHPVETAYSMLAMKMGAYPSLTGYHVGGVIIRRRGIPEPGEAGRMMPIITPLDAKTVSKPSFNAWPPETNPFEFKPPMFPALLTYGHHQVLGPKFLFYPLLAGQPEPARPVLRSRAVFEIQSWAVIVPYLSGLAVILLTFVLGWQLSGPGTGLLAAAMTAAHPYQSMIAAKVWPEATMTAFLLAAVILLVRFVSDRSWAGCGGAGILFALALLSDHAALFALPSVWLWTAAVHGAAPGGTPARPWPSRLLNPYILAFAAGAFVIGQSWLGYVPAAFQQSPFARASFEGLGLAHAAATWTRSAAGLVIFGLPLLAAFKPKKEAALPALIALSLVLTRWVYHPGAPWDERAWAAVIPFAALAAAPTLLSLAQKIFRKAGTA